MFFTIIYKNNLIVNVIEIEIKPKYVTVTLKEFIISGKKSCMDQLYSSHVY
ncbi:hypothetical protein QW060_26940 [Myroides ceti]|uniref:Uncharacterized protein n=1 Tax=Paenimyroides ceti TaxID=395087 RepID=A0ABT8D5D9_9FLAO|nr:hypothetical protein [Paenimyroides ceti]MDN3710454.1 hypothetical protein [Paenimyroides ceti]